VIQIVKDGLAKAIVVKGVSYNGEMPAWGQTLSVSDIAAVITYIRHSWGNSASAVTPAQVANTQ
jgi:mono/diheme cytochrome c family protein